MTDSDGRHLKEIGTDGEYTGGYLDLVVEEHYSSECTYDVKWINRRRKKKCLVRDCQCGRSRFRGGGEEEHYLLKCHWKKVQDSENYKVYLYRKCYCQPN